MRSSPLAANDNSLTAPFLEPLDRLRSAVDGLLQALDRQAGALEALHGSCQDLETMMTACDEGLASLCGSLAAGLSEAEAGPSRRSFAPSDAVPGR